ncbi:MAG: hypothetical protein Q8O09_06005 [Bacillota bacterium]|nr:hypothetical protein [Bacillota bacterium]
MAENPPLMLLSVTEGKFLAYIDGTLLGEAANNGKSLCVPFSPDGTHYILLVPLESADNSAYFPIAYKLCFSEGEFVLPCPRNIELVLWPQNIFSVQASPCKVSFSAPAAHMLRQMEWHIARPYKSYHVTLYSDSCLHACIEDPSSNETVFFEDFSGMAAGAAETAHLVSAESRELVIHAKSRDEGRVVVLSGEGGKVSVLLDETAAEVSYPQGQGGSTLQLKRIEPGLMQHITTLCYSFEGGVAKCTHSQSVLPSPPPQAETPNQLVRAFLGSLLLSLKDEVFSYMSPSLKSSLSLSDLKEYFGEFSGYRNPPFAQHCGECAQACIGLLYPVAKNFCKARVFRFEMSKGKGGSLASSLLINNIDEA